MPDVTVVAPAAVVPADRLTLGSCDARVDDGRAPNVTQSSHLCKLLDGYCMAEE